MRKGTVGAVALAGGLALVCSACGGNNPSASKTPRSQHKSHQTHKTHKPHQWHSTTTAPPSSTSSSATSTTAVASGPTTCAFTHLAITVGQRGAGLGHEGATLLFKNTGSSECALSGYPGVAALDASGKQVSQAQRTPSGYLGGMGTGSSTPPLVELQPGVTASAMVEGTDVPEGTATSCATYPALLVTPPTAKRSKRLTVAMPGCSTLQVHPVVSGTTGSTQPS